MSENTKKGVIAGLLDWVDTRLPIVSAFEKHMSKYYAPKNFNIWYIFGVLSILVLVNQLLTGIWLTMHYTPTAEGAFASIEYIMRDVPYGQYLRYMHTTGASAFFIVVYLHMFRGLMYGSYQKPRELVWIFGMFIYVALMAEAFMGYVLPWGQMSYWGATVIVSLFSAIPGIGEDLAVWIQGDYLISGATLSRFFALHVVALPIVLLLLVFLHIVALHEVGSNNPDGIEIKKNKNVDGIPVDGIPFHPYYTTHDIVGVAVFLFIFCTILFYFPDGGGYFIEKPNYEIANNLKTPEHIAPVWYFTPFYAMLRATTVEFPALGLDSKFCGFFVMIAAIVLLFFLPWLDRSPVKSMRYKGWGSRFFLLGFVISFISLGVLGVWAATEERAILGAILTVIYFSYFIFMPIYTSMEKVSKEPERVTGRWISFKQLIISLILIILGVVLPLKAVAAGGGDVEYKHVDLNFQDRHSEQASLQRGAKLYMNYCMGCHSLKYARYERTADDLGIPHDLMLKNLVFDDSKIGVLMTNAVDDKKAGEWFGTPPPDLTLSAKSRGEDWLYTYLLSFYEDPKRPWGANNKLFKDVGMPNVLLPLQGVQKLGCIMVPAIAENGGEKRNPANNDPIMEEKCNELVLEEGSGKLNKEEFKGAIKDLVHFLYYIADPGKKDREYYGAYALFYLIILFVFARLLNREYWKGIH